MRRPEQVQQGAWKTLRLLESTTSLSSRLLGELAHGGTAGNSGIEQNVSTCGNVEKVIRYRPSISLVARQCWSSRAGEAA
jgi:hypothetical protein